MFLARRPSRIAPVALAPRKGNKEGGGARKPLRLGLEELPRGRGVHNLKTTLTLMGAVDDMPTRSAAVPAKEEETGLAPLNFRVSAEFRREFKTYAAAHDLKLNKLLTLSFQTYRKQHGD
jgi:hypothetical protein